jgi:hypothetical protein
MIAWLQLDQIIRIGVRFPDLALRCGDVLLLAIELRAKARLYWFIEVNYRTVTPAFNSGIVRNAMRAYPNEFRCYRGTAQRCDQKTAELSLRILPLFEPNVRRPVRKLALISSSRDRLSASLGVTKTQPVCTLYFFIMHPATIGNAYGYARDMADQGRLVTSLAGDLHDASPPDE